MEYRFGKMYQGREKISYWRIDPKVLYYEEGNLTKTGYLSRKTGEVIKVTRIWRMKRRMKRIFYNILNFYSETPNRQRGVGDIKK